MVAQLAVVLLLGQTPDPSTAELIEDYLDRCATAHIMALSSLHQEFNRTKKDATTEGRQRLRQLRADISKLTSKSMSLLPLPMPPKANDVGKLEPIGSKESLGGKSIDLLEALDEDDAIVRVWYVPTPVRNEAKTVAETVTFLDVWLHGLDLREKKAGDAIRARPLVIARGTKTLGTDCGSRSFVYLEIERVEAIEILDKTTR